MTELNSKRKSNGLMDGVKAFIMIGSLAATLGGWGILAAGQVLNPSTQQSSNQNNVRTVNPNAVNPNFTDPNTVNPNNPGLRQVQPSNLQPRPLARSRSSR